MSTERGRSTAERATFAAFSTLLLIVALLIALQMRDEHTPPAPVAAIVGVRQVGDRST